jgi:hypothetical protein
MDNSDTAARITLAAWQEDRWGRCDLAIMPAEDLMRLLAVVASAGPGFLAGDDGLLRPLGRLAGTGEPLEIIVGSDGSWRTTTGLALGPEAELNVTDWLRNISVAARVTTGILGAQY